MARKEHEGERNVLASRIEALQQLVAQQSRQLETLTSQQERAYAQVQEIANKAVEGAQRASAAVAQQPRPQRLLDDGG